MSSACNSLKNKLIRQIVLRLLLGSIIANKTVLFFDETSFQTSSFKNKGWGSRKKRLYFRAKNVHPGVKVLSTISFKGLTRYKFLKKTNGQIITKFLVDTLSVIFKENPESEVVLLLDNAKTHHTLEMHKLAK